MNSAASVIRLIRHALILVLLLSFADGGMAAESRKHHKPKPKPKPKPQAVQTPVSPPKPVISVVTNNSRPASSGGSVISSSQGASGSLNLGGSTTGITQNGSPYVMQNPLVGVGAAVLADASVSLVNPGVQSLNAFVSGNVVKVTVPYGIVRVVVQRRASKGWKLVGTSYTNGSSQVVAITLRDTVPANELRVLGYKNSRFTPGQMSGESDFVWSESSLSGGNVIQANNSYAGNIVTLNGGAVADGGMLRAGAATLTLNGTALATTGVVAASNNLNAATTNVATASTTPTTTTTPVAVESDIWKVIGSRLFFFNQYRGLQVFDLTDPVHPVKVGSLRMAAKGEMFYALDADGSKLALLVRNDGRQAAAGNYSSVQILSVSDKGVPSLLSSIPVSGYMGESRLIGSRLYLVETMWQTGGASARYSYNGFRIHGYDLADAANPVDLGACDACTGYAPVLEAAGDYLLASTSEWLWADDYRGSRSRVNAIKISGTGVPRLTKVVNPKGKAEDQFKLSVRDHYLITVTEQPGWVLGEWGWWDSWNNRKITRVENADGTDTLTVTWTYTYAYNPSQTWIESFDLNTPSGDKSVSELRLDPAQGEDLHATRFDGSRLYVVTFGTRQEGFTKTESFTIVETVPRGGCDPLFIIDISDPTHLVLHGELEIPGWSTFIYPNGDRLLAVGREDSRVAISYYDVSNMDAPAEIGRVHASSGQGHYAWSEAENDHRAVNFLPDLGKAFVPFQEWTSSGYQSSMQVVNVSRDSLALGPVIAQTGTARRGTAVNGHLVSISGKQLVVASDPPSGDSKEEAWLELSWPVDRVVACGDYLVQIEDGNRYGWWGYSYTANLEPIVRLTSRLDPDTVLDSVTLGQGQIVGVEQRGSMVYIAQASNDPVVAPAPANVALTGGNVVSGSQMFVKSPVRIGYIGSTATSLRTWTLNLAGGKLVQSGSTLSSLAITGANPDNASPDISNVKGCWATPQTLVWHVPLYQSYYYPIYYPIAITLTNTLNVSSGSTLSGNLARPSSPEAKPAVKDDKPCALELPVTIGADGVAAAATSILVTMPANGRLIELSKPIASNGFIFLSSKRGNDSWGWIPPVIVYDAAATPSASRSLQPGEYASSLHVIDFTQNAAGDLRDPVSLPGTLLSVAGVDADGAWLITRRTAPKEHGDGSTSIVLQALAYDGLSARKVDQIDTNESWFGAVASTEGHVFVANSNYTGWDPVTYQSVYQSEVKEFRLVLPAGKLQKLAPWQLANTTASISDLGVPGNHIVASGWGLLAVARLNSDDTLTPQVELDVSTSWMFSPSRAVFDSAGSAIWMPVGDYGVEYVELK